MKKMLLKKGKNSFSFFTTMLLLSSCGGLGITESNFSQSNLKEFNIGKIDGLKEMPADEVKDFLVATEKSDDVAQSSESPVGETYTLKWYYCSWESTDELTAFTIYESSNCEDRIHYFVFSGAEFVSEKVVALSTNCGDWESRISSTKEGNTLSIASTDYEYGDVYPSDGFQKCTISSSGIECDSKLNLYPGVSLWNGLALRETPDKKGKYITLVNIGETFTTADSVEVSDEDEYLYVQLRDGTSGYILNRLVMQKAVPAVILKDAPIYRRPDALTKTSDTFYAMDVVGYSEMDEDYQWMKVKGRPAGSKWFKEGWIKRENASQESLNIAVASLVKKALEEEDADKRLEMLEAIRSNNDFGDSDLLPNVEQLLSK